jgi:enoyl-CoA hydratase/carnithine racemase
MSPGIVTRLEERILAIAFDRPDRRNAITSAMYTAMADALASAVDDANVRVVLLQGHETMFTAGNDIAEFRDADPAAESPAFRFLRALAAFPKPIVAAVSGPAVGIGTTMLLH